MAKRARKSRAPRQSGIKLQPPIDPHQLLNDLGSPVVCCSRNWEILFQNHASIPLVGEHDSEKPRRFWELIADIDFDTDTGNDTDARKKKAWHQMTEQLSETNGTIRLTQKLKAPDYENNENRPPAFFDVQLTVSIVSRSQPDHIYVTMTDVTHETERRRRYQQALTQVDLGVIELDHDFNLIHANSAAREQFNFKNPPSDDVSHAAPRQSIDDLIKSWHSMPGRKRNRQDLSKIVNAVSAGSPEARMLHLDQHDNNKADFPAFEAAVHVNRGQSSVEKGSLLTIRNIKDYSDFVEFLKDEGPTSKLLENSGIRTFIKRGTGDDGKIRFEYANKPFLTDVKDAEEERIKKGEKSILKGGREFSTDPDKHHIVGLDEFEIYPHEQAKEYVADDVKVLGGEHDQYLIQLEPHSPSFVYAFKYRDDGQWEKENKNENKKENHKARVIGFYWFAHHLPHRAMGEHWRIQRSVINDSPFNVFRKNEERECTYASQPYCDLLDLPRWKIIGQTDEQLHGRSQLVDDYRIDDVRVLKGDGSTLIKVEKHVPRNDPRREVPVLVMKHLVRSHLSTKTAKVELQGEFFEMSNTDDMNSWLASYIAYRQTNETDVFISYTSRDRSFIEGDDSTEGLWPQLQAIETSHRIYSWYDRKIPGQSLSVIKRHLDEAKVAIVFVSPEYIRPDGFVIEKELEMVLERRNRSPDDFLVLPVLLSKIIRKRSKHPFVTPLFDIGFVYRHALDSVPREEQRRVWSEVAEMIEQHVWKVREREI